MVHGILALSLGRVKVGMERIAVSKFKAPCLALLTRVKRTVVRS